MTQQFPGWKPLNRALRARVSSECLFAIVLLALALLGTFDCAWGKEPAAPNVPPPLSGAYLIQPGDLLEIFVWKEPDLSRKVLVRPDGFISFPLVQDLKAAGSPPAELKKAIEAKLADYVSAPNVTVVVDAIRSYTVFVVGKVQKPGEFLREQPVSVLQSLSLAGGFQEYANRGAITVFRNTASGNMVFKFNYDEVVEGKRASQNIILNSGDVVVVP